MHAAHLELRGFRNLLDIETALAPGLTTIHGANAAGKTNFLEALYFGLAGRSFRASRDREVIRFGEEIARVGVGLISDPQPPDADSAVPPAHQTPVSTGFLASISRSGERRLLVDGAQLAAADAAARRPPLAVFIPDRLGLVKGPPATRRAHLDRLVVALWPARSEVRARFGRALAQRNALLGRVRAGLANTDALDGWDQELAVQGVALREARNEAAALVAEPFAEAAEALGLEGATTLTYLERGPTGDVQELARALGERRDSDVRRGFTASGPHADELAFELDGRALRRYGSQGQQRISVLALLLAEREALIARGRPPPLTLLDDVMSELDATRRGRLADRLQGQGQVLITATDSSAVPEIEGASLAVQAGAIEARPRPDGAASDRPPGTSRAETLLSGSGARQ